MYTAIMGELWLQQKWDSIGGYIFVERIIGYNGKKI